MTMQTAETPAAERYPLKGADLLSSGVDAKGDVISVYRTSAGDLVAYRIRLEIEPTA